MDQKLDQFYRTGGEIMTCRSCTYRWSQRRGEWDEMQRHIHIHQKHPPEVSLVIINQLNDHKLHLPIAGLQLKSRCLLVKSYRWAQPSSGWVSSGFGRPGQWIADGPHTQNTLSAGSMFQTFLGCAICFFLDVPGSKVLQVGLYTFVIFYNIQVV